MKKNCWEHKSCGRESGGKKVAEFGICPVVEIDKLHGVHSGNAAGRACWVVAGTLCGGKVQGSFAKKFDSCEKCDFYLAVKQEEFPNFNLSAILIRMLKN